MAARLSRNLDASNCLQWAELSGRLGAVNRRIMHSGESIGSTFSLLSSLLFPDIPHRRVKTGNTKLDSESIIRPIYQLGSLCSKNKHITALQSSSPSLLLQGPSQHPVWRSGRTIGWLCYTDAVCGCHQGTSKCVPI